MAIQLKWMDDLRLQSDFVGLAIPYEIKAIKLSEVDVVASSQNGARLDQPYVPELVEDYKIAMQNGDVFPRIAVHKRATGYVILAGNQRFGAVRKLLDEGKVPRTVTMEAYVVQTDDPMLLECISRADNGRHGGRTSHDHRVQHALHMVRRFGMRPKDAARFFGVSDTTINLHLRAEKEREELIRSGIDASMMPIGMLNELSKVKFDDNSKVKIAHLAAKHSPPVGRVSQVIQAVKKSKSDSSRLGKVREFEKELASTSHSFQSNGKAENGHKVPGRPRRDYVVRTLKKLSEFLEHGLDGEPFSELDQLQITTDADIDAVSAYWGKIKFRLDMVIKCKKTRTSRRSIAKQK